MTILQNSVGRWVYRNDADGSYQIFSTEREARMAELQQTTIGEIPAEIEIAHTVTGELLPQLRSALLAMSALKLAWHANGISEMIADAQAAQAEIDAATPENPATHTAGDTQIAGLPASAWIGWGAVLTSLETWLNTPLDGTNTTPTTVLMRRYTR